MDKRTDAGGWVVVIGVGNEFRRDDGACPAVVTSLRGQVPPGVDLVLTDGEPTRLIEAWTGATPSALIRPVRAGCIASYLTGP